MDYFTAIPDGHAIIYSRGVYRQAPLFARGDQVYAKVGAGYIRLMQNGVTTSPAFKIADIDLPVEYVEAQGRITLINPKLIGAA